MTGHASWCDYVTFDTFLKKKVRASAHPEDGKLVVTYYCANPIVAEGVITVRYAVDADDNVLVNVDLLVEMMKNATSELYQADSDRQGIITPPEVPMGYSDCCNHVPPLEYEVIQ